jgi:hypothetical protein
MRRLVAWEHEDILLFNPQEGGKAQVILCDVDLITSGTFFPPKEVMIKYKQLNQILHKCKTGEFTFLKLLDILGFELSEFDEFQSFTEIDYVIPELPKEDLLEDLKN